ncbi:MAG: hypothetical protein M3N46_12615 [Actinomycetota bacterium]|nr:hypothetical protein [Actinomycetota bacterium]
MEVFALLAEPVRRRIIEILATGEHSAVHVADVIHTEFGVRDGWPYLADPLAIENLVIAAHPEGMLPSIRHSTSGLRKRELECDEGETTSGSPNLVTGRGEVGKPRFPPRALDILGRIMDDPPSGRLTIAVP